MDQGRPILLGGSKTARIWDQIEFYPGLLIKTRQHGPMRLRSLRAG